MLEQISCVGRKLVIVILVGSLAGVEGPLYGIEPIEVYVAPTGDDVADGGRERPVASLIGARDAVRRLRAAGKTGPVRVVVADGIYQMTEPLVLTPEDGGTADAPVCYEAAPGARPVFTGGRRITGFRPWKDGLWVAEVPEVATGKWYFEQLWVNGRRAVRAVEPDTKWEEIAKLPFPPGAIERARNPEIDPFFFEQEVVETALGGGRFRQTVIVCPEAMSLLAKLSNEELSEVQLVVCAGWSQSRRFISHIDVDRRSIVTEGPRAAFPWGAWHRRAWGSRGYFHLENFLGALDQPGEWFLARDGKLYYKPRPGEDMTKAEVVAPVAERFIVIQGDPADGKFVEHVTFKGLTFHHAQWLTPRGGTGPGRAATPRTEAAVQLDGARNILFQECEISHVGTYALWFRVGCSHCRVERCLLHDLGEGGVRIGEESAIRSQTAEQTHHITVHNNIIRSGGRIITDGVGVWIGQSYDNNVTHNDIGDFYYSGVIVGRTLGFGPTLATRNTISYNHIHHLGQWRMSDMGGVFSQGVQPGTIVSYNVIHDVYCWGYGGWGLYADEGSSSILFENNLVYNVSDGGFHQHYGRDNVVRNNIFAFSQTVQVRGTAQKKAGDHLSFTFERNIVYFDQGELFGRPWQWGSDVRVELKNNIYWRTDGKDLGFAGKSWDEWRAMGRDHGSLIADPKFVDPKNYDFRFASDEVIKQLGFQPFDYSQAGVYGDAPWIALAKGTPN